MISLLPCPSQCARMATMVSKRAVQPLRWWTMLVFSLSCLSACGDPLVGSGGPAGDDGGHQCSSDQVCDGVCVDFLSDTQNCGACGNACAGTEACNAGTCEVACDYGRYACGGECVDFESDVQHCGGCDQACADGEVCVGWFCRPDCAADRARCGNTCVDTTSDDANCGACGNACDATQHCIAGACEAT